LIGVGADMWLGSFIRFFGISMIALFAYAKILNIKKFTRHKVFASISFAILVSISTSYLMLFSAFITLVPLYVFVKFFTKDNSTYALAPVAIISVGVSFGRDVNPFSDIMLEMPFIRCYQR